MAAFNWFKRSYQEPEEPKKSEDQKQVVEEKPEETPASSEDYLNWAKAAYQNIQSRQAQSETQSTEAEQGTEAEQTQEPEESEKEVAADEATQAEASTEIASKEEVLPVEAAATVEASTPAEVLEPTAETEPDVEEVDTEPDPTEASETEVPGVDASVVTATDTASTTATSTEDATDEVTEGEPEPEPATARPFWAAQAEQERVARLERLQAEAILEPEPEPEPTPPEQTFVPLDIDLDEAFLWSAEVLASQGRRPDQISVEEITWLNKLRQGLDKTRRGLVNQLKSIVGQGPLNDEAVDEIEALLLQADVGVAATDKIISALQSKLREETLPPDQAIDYLKSLLRDMLESPLEGKHNLTFTPEKDKLSIWLMTGVNGAGKTTTIGKLAHIATKSEFRCLIGAADTFRAAAVEQVKVWGDRSGVEVIANPGKNTDPAAVVFDAISAANSRNIELLLIDTAGRLQNKKNLMDELSKVRKIIDKKAPGANVESLLVLDATLGQNGLRQAQVFAEAAQLSGVVLTKLDGTARGGVALAVVEQLGLPIRFIGAGEGIEDLRPFSSYEFIEALLSG
ncbi:signal recognition particle-docking protein FtsY, putative [Synechococcus sp. PCC 7335]|uniref:signal recognition particle-docking protein FtsY n=1 Tax=Synechococcus sp. (strain ATCC 29403 / PCC 7335) TaxID=91464 RepID=UPI00017ED611|nr:signal recognition particle-docking protein FtsY [Synechococcus sp. PCC 7335]EDX84060.1 signal recognition particle-docking protein FtsY, putative [Synechococcus sp. PCC 7335]